MKELTPLQKIQFEAIAKIEAYIETLDEGAEKGTAKENIRAHEQILLRIGYRKPKEQKAKVLPSRDHFKTKRLTDGEKALIAKNNKIDNSNAPKNAFKKVAGAKKEAKAIENSAPKNPFKKEDPSIIATEETKKGKKFSAYSRLNKEQKLMIWDMHQAKETVAAISEKLWITEKVINKFLDIPAKKKTKKASIEVAHNQKEGLQDFVDEVKDSE